MNRLRNTNGIDQQYTDTQSVHKSSVQQSVKQSIYSLMRD